MTSSMENQIEQMEIGDVITIEIEMINDGFVVHIATEKEQVKLFRPEMTQVVELVHYVLE